MKFPRWFKPAAWGAIAGAGLLALVASNTGWVVSSDTADQMARTRSKKAVLSSLTPICVAQFKMASREGLGRMLQGKEHAGTSQGAFLAALRKEDEWKRGAFVVRNGWATMPGSAAPNAEVAQACASELMKLTK